MAATADVRSATRTLRNRAARFLEDGDVVPLRADYLLASKLGTAERDTLRALCSVLATSERKQLCLTDPARVGRLIRDLAEGALRAMPQTMGARRTTTEVLTAMTALGLRHPFDGRPLPNEVETDFEGIVDRIVAHIAANPYAHGVDVEPDVVTAIVRRVYTEVEPWPFAALLD